ncbi:MAG: RHS repeat-associated core domain-containing protein [Planctomycetes bacterium]|nr:RHS repeat-associated core domain-containing protein [Planctomycetota bacterium]
MVKYNEMAMQTLSDLPTNMPVARVEFDYDYMSRRVGKTVYNWGSNSWQEVSSAAFLYDAWNLIAEQTSAETNFFTFGLDLSGTLQGAGGIGGLVSAVLGTNAVCYTYDGNGNVSELINCAGGKIDAHYEYSPFGETIVATGGLAKDNPFRFSAKYTDDETSLVYYGYRFYSPELGRWPSRDPINEHGGLNLYGFVENDPVTSIDVHGLVRLRIPRDPGLRIPGVPRFPIPRIPRPRLPGIRLPRLPTACTRANLDASRSRARDIWNRYERDYICCHDGSAVPISHYPDTEDGAVTSHGVLHNLMGCQMREDGFGVLCLIVANFGYEASTIIDEWIRRGDRGFRDWLRDTGNDLADVFEGYFEGGPCDGKFVPGECSLRSEREDCCEEE